MKNTSEISKLENDMRMLLNRESEENKSDTPDWVLASYLRRCLDAFNDCINMRERFYGRELEKCPHTKLDCLCNDHIKKEGEMKKELKEIKERLERIEKKIELPYPLKNLLDCRIDFDLHIRPLYPLNTTQTIQIQQLENRLKSDIYTDIKNIESKINNYLRYC